MYLLPDPNLLCSRLNNFLDHGTYCTPHELMSAALQRVQHLEAGKGLYKLLCAYFRTHCEQSQQAMVIDNNDGLLALTVPPLNWLKVALIKDIVCQRYLEAVRSSILSAKLIAFMTVDATLEDDEGPWRCADKVMLVTCLADYDASVRIPLSKRDMMKAAMLTLKMPTQHIVVGMHSFGKLLCLTLMRPKHSLDATETVRMKPKFQFPLNEIEIGVKGGNPVHRVANCFNYRAADGVKVGDLFEFTGNGRPLQTVVLPDNAWTDAQSDELLRDRLVFAVHIADIQMLRLSFLLHGALSNDVDSHCENQCTRAPLAMGDVEHDTMRHETESNVGLVKDVQAWWINDSYIRSCALTTNLISESIDAKDYERYVVIVIVESYIESDNDAACCPEATIAANFRSLFDKSSPNEGSRVWQVTGRRVSC